MPEEEEEKTPEDFSAELLILEDMGVEPEKLERVNSKAAAEKLIKYYESKKDIKKNKKKMLNLKANQGTKLSPLPDPEPLNDPVKLNLRDALDPLSPKKAVNARWNKSARILMIFDEEHPNGRVF